MDDWSIAKQNIKPGIAFAGLLVSGHSAPVSTGLLLCPECYAEHKVDASMANIVCV